MLGLHAVQKQTRLTWHGGPCRYGFHKEPAGGKDSEGQKKARLLEIFGHWTDMVTDLIRATPEEDVLRRDIFDRPPIFKWTQVPARLPLSRRRRVVTCGSFLVGGGAVCVGRRSGRASVSKWLPASVDSLEG